MCRQLAQAGTLPADLDFPIESICSEIVLHLHHPAASYRESRENLVTMISRVDFDYALIGYGIKKGVQVFAAAAVEEVIPHGDGVEVVTGWQRYTASYAVLAEGANARLSNSFWSDDRILMPAIESEIMLSAERIAEFQGAARFDFVPSGYGWVFFRKRIIFRYIASKFAKQLYFSDTIRRTLLKKFGQRLVKAIASYIEGKRSYRGEWARRSMLARFLIGLK